MILNPKSLAREKRENNTQSRNSSRRASGKQGAEQTTKILKIKPRTSDVSKFDNNAKNHTDDHRVLDQTNLPRQMTY